MTAVILDGGTGTNTLSVQDGSSIASAIVLNFPNLTFDATGVTLTNDVTMSASQNQLFTGTITAAGTGANSEKITIVGDGAVTTLAGVETYSVGDDSTNARTVTVSNAGTSVTANSATDAVTFNLGTLAYTGTITGDATTVDTLSLGAGANISGSVAISGVTALTLASGASVTMTAAQNQLFTGAITADGTGGSGEKITITGDGPVTARSNIETYELGDDTTNARAMTLGSAALNMIANNGTDTVTVDAATLAQNTALTVAAASASNLTVNGLVGNIVATNLSGTLTVTTANAADNGISITTGSADTAVNVAAGAASDTVSINAAALANGIALTITSGGLAAGIVNITNLAGNLVVSNPNSGTIGIVVTDNTVDNGIAITAGAANLAITGVADGDTVTVTGFTGSTLTGALAGGGTTGKFNITAGTGNSVITTAAGDDTFTFTAGTGLTLSDTVNGGAGTDTVTLDGTGVVLSTDFNAVTTIEVIKFTNRASGNVSITTKDTLVADGATLTLTHAGTGTLTFDGSVEKAGGGKFDITESTGTGVDSITGGDGDDKFTFVASNLTTDTVNGKAGTDTLNLTGTGTVTLTNVSNIEVITLPDMTSTAVTITTPIGLVATGATLTLSNAANSGILTFNGGNETDSNFNITGGSNNDSITGGAGNDTIAGNSGDDNFTFVAGTGLTSADTVDGGAGADKVTLTGNTTITAGDYFDLVKNIEVIVLGNTSTAVTITTKDTLVASGAILTLSTITTGALTFNGGNEADGAFNITSNSGNDIITGGKGNDVINGGNGTNNISGGEGDDTLTGGTGNDTLDGGAGNDTISDSAGTNTITAGLGNDTITGGTGADTFTFAAVTGLTSADTVDGSTGADTVALTGDTAFTATNDFDKVSNIETITLTNTTTAVTITTQDTLVASGATLTLSNAVNSGALTFDGKAELNGNFNITGGTGNDGITGGAGADTLAGGNGDDTLIGSGGSDTITGEAGNDSITGGEGIDIISSGIGADTITLTESTPVADVIVFGNASTVTGGTDIAFGALGGADSITGFGATDDLRFDQSAFGLAGVTEYVGAITGLAVASSDEIVILTTTGYASDEAAEDAIASRVTGGSLDMVFVYFNTTDNTAHIVHDIDANADGTDTTTLIGTITNLTTQGSVDALTTSNLSSFA